MVKLHLPDSSFPSIHMHESLASDRMSCNVFSYPSPALKFSKKLIKITIVYMARADGAGVAVMLVLFFIFCDTTGTVCVENAVQTDTK